MTTTPISLDKYQAYTHLLQAMAEYIGDSFDQSDFVQYVHDLDEGDLTRVAYETLGDLPKGIGWSVSTELKTEEYGEISCTG